MMGKHLGTERGFTLLELLMVVIIIGILGAIALPQYMKTREKTFMAEAISTLGSIRSSQARFFAESEPNAYAANINQLDFDPSAGGSMIGTPRFTYSITGGGATFTANAVRNGAPLAGSGCQNLYRVAIDQNGTWTGRDCQQT